MKKVSLKSISIILLSWFLIIPLTEMVVSNFMSPESSSILLSMEKGDEIRYKNINMEEEISDIKILFEKEFEENTKLANIINKEALMKLDFEENVSVLGLFFVEDYYFNLIKDEGEERYYNYLTEKGKVVESISTNSLIFEYLFDIQREGYSNLFTTKHKTTFNIDDAKIKLENEELVDKIKALVYKEYLLSISYSYGYVFLVVFLIAFTLYTMILEQKYLRKNINAYSLKMVYELEEKMVKLLQPTQSIVCVIIGFIILLMIGLLIGLLIAVVPFYTSGIDSLSFSDFLSGLVKPLNYLSFTIGNLYIQNIPLSRILLLVLMPTLIVLYMLKVSPVSEAVEVAKNNK